jgi:oxygen-independent coproporphyrinogen-3 oxidase
MSLGLYIHIPFCASRCPYCDFTFVVGKRHLVDRYTEAVIQEWRTRLSTVSSAPVFTTVYFGGGTPSAVPPECLERILTVVRTEAGVAPYAEITVEANPGDRERFAALWALGINRLSLGVQAFTDRALKALGRFHTTREAEEALAAARYAGFHNVNLDLIFGAPEQSVAEWITIVDRALSFRPEHLSVYGLTIEPGTAFGRRFVKGRLPLPTEEEQAAMYEVAIDRLTAAGYDHYEISNFAWPGFASCHNMAYWEGIPYLGIGVSAHSFLHGCRSWNTRDLLTYIAQVEANGIATEGKEVLSEEDRFLEQVLLGLRRPAGIPTHLLSDPRIVANVHRLLADHLLEQVADRLRLTRRGLLLADLVCTELVNSACVASVTHASPSRAGSMPRP